MTKRLLIVTQKIDKNDSYFGFFHDWIIEFAKHVDFLVVVSLEVHSYDFPKNVTVLSLGKENGKSKLKYLFNFYEFILTEKYDTIFAHMSPVYMILGFPFWLTKKRTLWYVHRNVDLKLRIAHLFSNIIFTATKESFNIPSAKVSYMNQAIDIDKFSLDKEKPKIPTIVTVGRITAIKRLEILIEAVKDLDVKVNIIGEAVMENDLIYKEKIRELVRKFGIEDKVNFIGPVANKDLPKWYAKSTISINLCPTGGLDKVVLESMASRIPVLVSNRAFLPYIEKYKELLLFENVNDCKEKIQKLINIDTKEIEDYLFDKVKEKSSLGNLINNIVSKLYQKNEKEIDICYFASDYPPSNGGISTYVVEWLSVVSEVYGIKAYIFNNKKPRQEDGVSISNNKNAFIIGLKIFLIILKSKASIFHALYVFPIGFWVVFWAKIFGKKSIVTIYGTDIASTKSSYFVGRVKRWTLDNATKVIAISHSTSKFYPNSIVIYPTVPKIEKVAIEKVEDFIVLSTSRLVKRKGIEYLVQAINSLSIPVKLLIASDGPERRNLEGLAGEKVQFLGKVDNLSSLYQSASVVALTSYSIVEEGDYEGLGLVLLEAQSFGKPVIGTNSGGIPETFEDGITGVMVPEKDSNSIALAIEKLYNDKELYKKMSKSTSLFLERRFGKKRMQEEYKTLINNILENNS